MRASLDESAPNRGRGQQNGFLNGANEHTALLKPNGSDRPSIGQRLHRHMTAHVSNSWADIALLGCYMITGLLDSATTYIWGSFVSMQTGNTIYLGLGLTDPGASNRWINSIDSIALFCIGSLLFSSFHRAFSPRRRWVMVTSYFLQMIFIIAAAVIVTFYPIHVGGDLHWSVLVPLGMLALQAGGQTVTSRVLQHNPLTTSVLTSIYCDLFSDAKLFSAAITENPERNRKAAAPILLLLGAIGGGLFANSSIGLAGSLWTAAGLKFLVVIAWFCWAAESESED